MRVDFYILTEEAFQAKLTLACRLLEKAYQRGHKVFVLCDTEEEALTLDELLWTFKEERFIPHHLQGEGPTPPAPIQIGYGPHPKGFNDILINLSSQIPTFHTQFTRLIEIVSTTEEAKIISRTHYLEYRKLGYQLQTHNL